MADASAYAQWLVENKDKQGTPEFETVASAYKQARTAQNQAPERPSLPIRFGANVWEGAASLPGLPVELAAWAKGIPVAQSNLKDWGAKGWADFADRNIPGGLPSRKLPAAQGDAERVADKAGQFFGGGLPFGPAGMVATGTSLLGSEAGRATDQLGLTGGYGETVGAIAGGLAPAAVEGSLTAATKTAPTSAELKNTARAFYNEADNAGVIVNQSGVTRLARSIRGDLGRMAFRPKLQPKIASLLDEVDTSLQAGNVTLQDLDSIRKVARNVITGTTDATERLMANKVIDHIDNVIDTLSPSEVVAGDAAKGAEALKSARDNWKRAAKSDIIDEAVTKAENRASSTGTGGNTENAIRQNLRAILDNPKRARMFSAEERAAIVKVVRGGKVQDILRLVGTLSPDKGFMNLVAGGAAVLSGNPAMMAIPLAGSAARTLSEALNARNVRNLSETVRSGGSNAPQLSAAQRAQMIAQEAKRRAALLAQTQNLPPAPFLSQITQNQD